MRVFSFVSFLVWVSIPLLADRIRLISGDSLEGRVLSLDQNFVRIETSLGIKNLPTKEVESLEVGYEGLPVCLTYGFFSRKDCNLLLVRLTPNQVEYVRKDKQTQKLSMPLEKVKNMSFLRDVKEKDISRFLEPGSLAEWKTKDQTTRARLVQKNKGILELETTDKKKRKILVPEKEILGFEIVPEKSVAVEVIEETPKLIPGYAPVERKQYSKGAIVFSMALAATGAMVFEYNEAVKAINNDRDFIPLPDGRILIAGNVLRNDDYYFHRQRYYGYGAVLSLVLGYSLLDTYYLGQREDKDGKGTATYLNVRFGGKPVEAGTGQPNAEVQIQVETQF